VNTKEKVMSILLMSGAGLGIILLGADATKMEYPIFIPVGIILVIIGVLVILVAGQIMGE